MDGQSRGFLDPFDELLDFWREWHGIKYGRGCLATDWQRRDAKASPGHFGIGGLTGNFHARPHTLSV
jgi:hypothetical protein